jgi:endonuclease YncB( thermonuclease family)
MKTKISILVAVGLLFGFTKYIDNKTYIVKKIIDGDTIKVFDLKHNIRLKCVDAPESNFFGKAQFMYENNIGLMAKEYLQSLLPIASYVELQCDDGLDATNTRLVCYILYNGVNINHQLIQDGYVYTSKKYCTQEEIKMFTKAKEEQKGLWRLGEWQNPCQFRGKCK